MPSKKQRAKAKQRKATKQRKKLAKEWNYGAHAPNKNSIWCMYKGTTYPQFPMLTQEEWTQLKQEFDKMIEEGLQYLDIECQTIMYIGMLDLIESCIHEFAQANPDVWEGQLSHDDPIVSELGRSINEKTRGEVPSLKHGMTVWYMGVYFLLRVGKIQEDNMNGWMVFNTKGENTIGCSEMPEFLPTHPAWDKWKEDHGMK
jgi:hypothetical protein